MPHLASFAAMLVLLVGSIWAADEAPETKLPEAVQSMIDRAISEISKERQKYDAAAKKLTDKLVADLKKEVEKATKAGNLKLALAIQAQVDEASKGGIVTKVDESTKSGGDLLGENSIESRIAGRWKYTDGNREFIGAVISKNILTNTDGNTAQLSFNGITITAKWASGPVYTYVYDEKLDAITGNNRGGTQTLTRMK